MDCVLLWCRAASGRFGATRWPNLKGQKFQRKMGSFWTLSYTAAKTLKLAQMFLFSTSRHDDVRGSAGKASWILILTADWGERSASSLATPPPPSHFLVPVWTGDEEGFHSRAQRPAPTEKQNQPCQANELSLLVVKNAMIIRTNVDYLSSMQPESDRTISLQITLTVSSKQIFPCLMLDILLTKCLYTRVRYEK